MPKLFIILDKCVNNGTEQISCPYAGSGRTVGAGYAMDYFCKLVPDKKETYGFKLTSGMPILSGSTMIKKYAKMGHVYE